MHGRIGVNGYLIYKRVDYGINRKAYQLSFGFSYSLFLTLRVGGANVLSV